MIHNQIQSLYLYIFVTLIVCRSILVQRVEKVRTVSSSKQCQTSHWKTRRLSSSSLNGTNQLYLGDWARLLRLVPSDWIKNSTNTTSTVSYWTWLIVPMSVTWSTMYLSIFADQIPTLVSFKCVIPEVAVHWADYGTVWPTWINRYEDEYFRSRQRRIHC